jgi:hypothetical protein
VTEGVEAASLDPKLVEQGIEFPLSHHVSIPRLCLAKTLSVPEINSLRNFLNRKICYDYGPCSTFRDYV